MFTRAAPADLTPPDWMLAKLAGTERTDYIDGQGFDHAQLKPEWWLERGITISMPSSAHGEPVLTRGDLFLMADAVSDDDSLLFSPLHRAGNGCRSARAG